MKKNTISSLVILFILGILQGCGTQYAYHQEESEILKVKHLSIEQFIKDKIIDSQHIVVKGILATFDPLDKAIRLVQGGSTIKERENYRKENFIYQALFDFRNQALTKPKNDLKLFCKVKGGKLHTKFINRTNLANSGITSPLQAYISIMQSKVTDQKAEIKITSDFSIPVNVTKEQIAETYAEEIESRNLTSGIYQAKESIDRAIINESFGEFSCISERNKEELWTVTIIPLILIKNQPVITDSPFYTMYIAVVPLKK